MAVVVLGGVPLAARPSQAGAEGTRTVYVSVLSADHKPVAGLTAADFAVQEDGAPRQITAVAPATDPLAVAILADTTTPVGVMSPVTDLRNSVIDLANALHRSNPATQTALFEFGGTSMMDQRFTADPVAFSEAAKHLFPKPGAHSVLLEAVEDAAKSFPPDAPPHRVIVAMDYEQQQEDTQMPPQEILGALRASGAQLWCVSISSGPAYTPGRIRVLQNLAADSGGAVVNVTVVQGVGEQFQQIAKVLAGQYQLTYVRPAGAHPKQLRVGVHGQGLFVAAPGAAPK